MKKWLQSRIQNPAKHLRWSSSSSIYRLQSFTILPNVYDGASVFLWTMINLTNLMKISVFIFFLLLYLQQEKGVLGFIDIFTYCNVKNSLIFNRSISNKMSLSILLITVTQLEGSKGGDRPLIIIVNNSINNNLTQFCALIVQLYNLERSFVFASVSEFLGVQILNIKR